MLNCHNVFYITLGCRKCPVAKRCIQSHTRWLRRAFQFGCALRHGGDSKNPRGLAGALLLIGWFAQVSPTNALRAGVLRRAVSLRSCRLRRQGRLGSRPKSQRRHVPVLSFGASDSPLGERQGFKYRRCSCEARSSNAVHLAFHRPRQPGLSRRCKVAAFAPQRPQPAT